MEAQAEYWSFPTNPDEFDQDERISYSKLDNKYIAVQDDGAEYEFDNGLKRWIPVMDEALIEEQQRGYMMPHANADAGDDDRRGSAQGRKRKMDYSNDREDNNTKGRSSKPAKRPPQPKQNTAVYVTGLPSDATAEEVAELFSRKCGVIAEEIDSGRPRIKMYTDGDGNFKGDALIVFFKPQSVDMAIMLLDDTDFRFGESAPTKMRVQAADSSYKKTKYDGGDSTKPAERNSSSVITSSSSSTQPPSNNPAQTQRHNQDKAKIIRKTQKLSAKLADWSDDEPSTLPNGPHNTNTNTQPPLPNSKHDRTIILTHMFTLAELAADPTAILEIKDDIREECSKLGAVTNVVLYDEEEDGIVSVKFQARDAAEACLRVMHGRAFAGRIVEAFFATGKEGFKRSRGEGAAAKERDEDGEED